MQKPAAVTEDLDQEPLIKISWSHRQLPDGGGWKAISLPRNTLA